MDFASISELFSNSASIRLIRAQNSILILSFLHKEFKENNRLVIPHDELNSKLCDFISSIHADDLEKSGEPPVCDEDMEARAKKYLDYWTEQNFLRKFPDETGEHMHELTSATEKTLQWIEVLEKKEFVGTESRFKEIFKRLKDLVENSTDDPIEKIKELEKKKQDIDEEIRQIKINQNVVTFNETQIKERFFEVNRIARELVADFKEVEQNFKDIIRNIYEKQADKSYTKGKIIGYALDSLEELKRKDQGRSFYSFWQFLIGDKSQDELKGLVDAVYELLEEKGIQYDDDRFLKKIKSSLYAAGKKVIDSNKQLSAKLNKVLSERDMADRRKAMDLISDIRMEALKAINQPPKQNDFILIDGFAEVNMVMNRPLGEEPHEPTVLNHPSDADGLDISNMDFDSLFNQFMINKGELISNINTYLESENQVSLATILEKHPVQKGLSELLTYMSIASQSNKHIISSDEFEVVEINKKERKFIRIPQVIYTR